MRACVRACAFAIKPLDFCQLLSMGLCKINKLALAVIEVILHVCVPVFVVRVPVQCVHFYPSHHVGKSCGSTKIEGLDKAAH